MVSKAPQCAALPPGASAPSTCEIVSPSQERPLQRVWDAAALSVPVTLDFGYLVFLPLALQNAH